MHCLATYFGKTRIILLICSDKHLDGRDITLDLLAPDPFKIMLSKGGSL